MLGRILPPSKPGVYVLRLKHHFGRLRGSSDILYIGNADNISRRIVKDFLRHENGKTAERIYDYISNKGI